MTDPKHGIYILFLTLLFLVAMLPTYVIMTSLSMFNTVIPEYTKIPELHTMKTFWLCIASYVCGLILGNYIYDFQKGMK